MDAAPSIALLGEIYNFLTTSPTLEEILDYQPPEELTERLHYLLDLNIQGRIAIQQQAELERFRQSNHFMNMLKIHARKKLTAFSNANIC
ncbi:MAG: hypothetical protein DPW16_10415 [Chloroflexi bacterium]|nr:hypothetical protein [Chloroflexota bacterium]